MNIPANLQRRPFLAPIGLLALTALTALAGVLLLIAGAWLLITSTSTTIIVVRHAPQILGGNGGDPGLSADGEARAAALARMLGDTRLKSRVAAIYVSSDLRSRATAAPLAQSLGLSPQVVSEDDARALARRVLREHPGETSLIVGHAGSVSAIVSALSGKTDIPAVTGPDYDTVYVVTVPRIGRAGVLRLKYGAP
jgi:broad specificity phosphatase PhoE